MWVCKLWSGRKIGRLTKRQFYYQPKKFDHKHRYIFGGQRMCTGEGSKDKIRREKRRGKLHWLCWGLFSADSIIWTEGNKGTTWRLQ